MKYFILVVLVTMGVTLASGQCPANEADLQDGGTFSGNCDVAVGASITITGNVTWLSGTLNITGSSGNLFLDPGATFDVVGGNVFVNDDGNTDGDGDGQIQVRLGAGLTIAAGASVTCATTIQVLGDVDVAGSLSSEAGQLMIQANASGAGTVRVSGDGTLSTGSTGDASVAVFGSNVGQLIIQDNAIVTFNGDLEINGGFVLVQGGTLNVGNTDSVDGASADLNVYNGGVLQIANGSTVAVEDDITNSAEPYPSAGTTLTTAGTISVSGNLTGGGLLHFYNSESSDSQLQGTATGIITVQNTFADAECPEYADGVYAFCNCTGGGTPCAATLPVTLTDFTGGQSGNTIHLQWNTASEIDNDFFEIERLTDQDTFEPIAQVDGSGTTFLPKHYEAVDATPRQGKNYYKLSQTDYDGTTVSFDLISVDFESVAHSMVIFPNPTANKRCKVLASGFRPSEVVSLSFQNAIGGISKKVSLQMDEAGSIELDVDLSNMSTGIYFAQAGPIVVKVIVH